MDSGAQVASNPIDVITRFIAGVRAVRDEFEPLGVPARRIDQLGIVIMEAEAELRRLQRGSDATEQSE